MDPFTQNNENINVELDITTIPLADIYLFLSSNNIVIPSDIIQAYEIALQLIQTNRTENVPTSIADWIIAYNLILNGVNIENLSTSSILFAPDNTLISLADDLMLGSVDKERIIRILGYLNVLDNDISIYDMLPDHVLLLILQNMDCKTILLTCKISEKFKQLCKTGQITQILRDRLTEKTRLNLNSYNQEELANVCKYTRNINICASSYSVFYIKHGNVYGYGKYINELYKTNIPLLIEGLNKIKAISDGSEHMLALDENGKVYSFGNNGKGQLGLGYNINEDQPMLIPGFNNIIEISAGHDHSLILTEDGNVYSFGDNYYGQLGLGDNINRNIPTLIQGIKNIVKISAGSAHSLLLTQNGEIYSFGNNARGQLGLGDNINRNMPTLILGFNNIVQISAGMFHSLILTNEDKIYSFGANQIGQLGLGDDNNRNIPTLISIPVKINYVSAGYSSLALTENGQIYTFGGGYNSLFGPKETYNMKIPTIINGINDVIQISIGMTGSLILNKYGEIYFIELTNRENGTLLLLDKIW
jgi:alpha-tubulin suppressor-like RCC1 family protein